MNKRHLEMLASPRWAEMLERDLLPWVSSVADLGADVLEIGPGPGLTTDLLRTRAARVTAVEVDKELVDPRALARRLGAVGFRDVEIDHGEYDFRFCARKPVAAAGPDRT
jgi:protein-L-isoaspartate O-methyltransferase